MERKEILEKVREVLSEEFEAEGDLITEDAPLLKTLDLDSLDVVDMVVLIEENFGFKMRVEDFRSISTFGDLLDVIEARTNE